MKKKLIATLVAGVVLSAGLVSLTACGGGLSINKGEEVDAEAWAAAFTASANAKNYTFDEYDEAEVKMTGSIEEMGITDLNVSSKSTNEEKSYYDAENGSYYTKSTVKVTVSGVPDELKDEDEFKAQNFVSEEYAVKEGDTYYSAYYNGSSETPEWNVNESSYSYVGTSSYLFTQTFATEEDGATATLSALYDSFTYSSGVYTATLWQHGVEVKVSVSVKGGYVVGLSSEFSSEEGDDNMKMTMTVKSVYNFSNYGSTTVKASDAAKKAVEDYKNED